MTQRRRARGGVTSRPRGMTRGMESLYRSMRPAQLLRLASEHEAFVAIGKGHPSTLAGSSRIAVWLRAVAAEKRLRR